MNIRILKWFKLKIIMSSHMKGTTEQENIKLSGAYQQSLARPDSWTYTPEDKTD